MHSKLKSLIEAIIVRGGASSLIRRSHRGRLLVLAYHNVVPDVDWGGGERSLHLTRTDFAAQLDMIMETHEVVPLAEIGTAAGGASRPRVAITFDDGYRGAVTIGLAELQRRRLPATYFLTPGRIGSQAFWWDSLANAEPDSWEGFRDRALLQLAGHGSSILEWARRNGMTEEPVPASMETASVEELASASRVPGITFAAHTWDHPNLAALDEAQLLTQLERPLEWLREHFPDVTIPWLTFPYGCSSPAVEAAVERAGYEAAFLVSGGWVPAAPNQRFALPRINIPAGMTARGFRLRLDGVLTD